MAGQGPTPKPAGTRRRRNADRVQGRVIEVKPSAQPELPESMPGGDRWPARTVAWWRMWAESPLAAEFTSTDWSELLDTAVLHGSYWSGDVKVAGELRLRVAKFGATPEDRARLRITFAVAEKSEREAAKPAPKRKPAAKGAVDPRAALHVA